MRLKGLIQIPNHSDSAPASGSDSDLLLLACCWFGAKPLPATMLKGLSKGDDSPYFHGFLKVKTASPLYIKLLST